MKTEELIKRLRDESYATSSDVWYLRTEAADTLERIVKAWGEWGQSEYASREALDAIEALRKAITGE